MKEFAAEVIDIRLESRIGKQARWQMLLSETAFSVSTGRGQLDAIAPSGARLEVPVLGVVIDGDDVWHVVEKPLAAGTPVMGRVICIDSGAG